MFSNIYAFDIQQRLPCPWILTKWRFTRRKEKNTIASILSLRWANELRVSQIQLAQVSIYSTKGDMYFPWCLSAQVTSGNVKQKIVLLLKWRDSSIYFASLPVSSQLLHSHCCVSRELVLALYTPSPLLPPDRNIYRSILHESGTQSMIEKSL